jgi:hypothetical protein
MWLREIVKKVALAMIRNLDNRVVYDVIVKAQNMFGISQPSELFNFYVNHKGRRSLTILLHLRVFRV